MVGSHSYNEQVDMHSFASRDGGMCVRCAAAKARLERGIHSVASSTETWEGELAPVWWAHDFLVMGTSLDRGKEGSEQFKHSPWRYNKRP